MKSIIKSARRCFFCGAETNLELHHVMHGTANRRLADADGLTVYLCSRHHRELHDSKNGADLDNALKRAGEYAWIKKYGNGNMEQCIAQFRQRYGKNYLDLEDE